MTDFVYRKYAQANFGGWAIVHVDETSAGHVVTPQQAAAVAECARALQAGDSARCRELPHVMQALGVGADADCWFREWASEGRPSPGGEALLCPTPSWLQPASATDSAGGGCWHTHFHATLTPRPHASGGDERCAGRHATEAAALAACLDDAACDGVTRDEKRELGAIEQACGARVHYSLRSLPLRPYRGVWSGATTWVKLRGAARAECQRGVARLAELAAQPVPVPSGWEPPPLGVGGASVAELELLEEEHRREERLARVAAQGVTSATGSEPEQGGDV